MSSARKDIKNAKKIFYESKAAAQIDASIHKVKIGQKSQDKEGAPNTPPVTPKSAASLSKSATPKSKKDYLWFLKPASEKQAYCEVIGQEFFRLLAPELEDQPKTRIADYIEKTPSSPASKSSLFVASKQVEDFTSIQQFLGSDKKNKK